MSLSLLCTWWAMVRADAELAGEPIADDAVVLKFMGSGASCLLTKKQLDEAVEEADAFLQGPMSKSFDTWLKGMPESNPLIFHIRHGYDDQEACARLAWDAAMKAKKNV